MDAEEKQDNRKQQRVLLTEKLLVDIKKNFQCIDISEGGLYLSTGNIFAENCFFDVTIPYKNKKVTVKAQIRHFQPGVGVGIEFVDVSDSQRAVIKEIIESIMSHYKADREDKILLIEDHDMSRKINRINLVEGGFLVITKPWPAMLRTIYGDDERYKQTYWKRIKNVIFHYKKNKNIFFLCIGGNKNINHSNIREIKYISDDKRLSKFYSASDLFILSSKAENSPLTILEAMACGTPIVSFNLGGINELIAHMENGYLADYNKKENLIDGIEYLFSLNQEKLKKISNNSIKKIHDSFTLDLMVNGYLNLYKQILLQPNIIKK